MKENARRVDISIDFEKEFYSRTQLFAKHAIRGLKDYNVLAKLKKSKVAIVSGEDVLQTKRGQCMASLSMNLLCRFCPRIDLVAPPNTPYTPYSSSSKQRLSFLRHLIDSLYSINPLGKFSTKKRLDNKYDAILSIGENKYNPMSTISIDANGWVANVNNNRDADKGVDDANPFGAEAAACLGVAEVLKRIFADVHEANPVDVAPTDRLSFSTFDYTFNKSRPLNPPFPPSISIDDLTIIGCGAVGSAVTYSLFSIPNLNGRIKIVDPGRIKTSNLNRYLLVSVNDALSAQLKVNIIKRHQPEHIDIATFPMTFNDYWEKEKHKQFDIVVVGVDDDKTRWNIQETFPRVIINGATDVANLTVSRHDDYLNKHCLGCVTPRRRDEGYYNTYQPCATISFVSALAGILITTEIVKECVKEYRWRFLDSEVDLNPLNIHTSHRVWKPAKSDMCGCRCSDSRVIKKFLEKKEIKRR